MATETKKHSIPRKIEVEFCSGCHARLEGHSCSACGFWGSRGEYSGPNRMTVTYIREPKK